MSINCLACTQNLANKNGSGAPTSINITSTSAPGPFNPFYYLTATTSTKSSDGVIISCTCVISNQTAPYTFCNGNYYMTSSCLTTQVSGGGDLYLAFNGNGSGNIFLSPYTYNSSGGYTGTVSTTVSGSAITGEWMGIQIPYKLWVTTYNIFTNAAGGGGSWNSMFPKNYTLAGSNNGTTWTLIDSKTGYSATSSTGINNFTAPTATQGFTYFRLIGSAIGAGSFLRMGVALGLQGQYKFGL